MAKAAVSATVEFEAIDRLEQKLKQLVSVLDKTRGDLARAKDDNGRLRAELDAARARIADQSPQLITAAATKPLKPSETSRQNSP